MADEVGIVMSLYDKVSPTLKAIAGNTKAFDKNLDDLETSLKAYDKAQQSLTGRSADLKKAMAETDLKVREAQKSYRKLKDETSKGALNAAIDEQTRLRQELTETESAIKSNNDAYKSLYKSANAAATAASKADNRANASSGSGILSALGKAGLGKMAGDTVMELTNTVIGSMFGKETGTILSSGLSGAVSGAAMGSMIGTAFGPGVGTAIGAAIGGALGVASGASQNFSNRDDAFKSYYQEQTESQLSQRGSDIAAGSAIAGNRETKQLAFSTLLGSDQAAESYLKDVQDMAENTNYTYDEITTYAKSLVKPFGAGRSLDVLTSLSDASAALSLNESDNSVLIAGLSRMKLTNKTTQEYLNYFSERGIDVYDALSKWGDAATVATKVSKGKIKGSDAVDEILAYLDEQYGGLSEKMANTYDGMADNLADAEANAKAAYGEGYNEKRIEGMRAQKEWMSSGVQDEANRAIGAWQAELENSKEKFVRDAVDAAIESTDYQTAKAKGDAAEMGRIIMQAKAQGMNDYNASEGAQLALESELALAAAIRDDADSNDAYWNAGYRKSQEYSKGLAAGFANQMTSIGTTATTPHMPTSNQLASALAGKDSGYNPYPHAYGLNRVPYDGYAALLHEGERVLTAREARSQDQSGGAAPVMITGNSFIVRQDGDIDAIAQALWRKVKLAGQGGARD